jgi:predicted amidohydrolase
MSMPKKPLRVAVMQMTSQEDVTENKKYILKELKKLEAKKVHLVTLPENALYLRVQSKDIPAFSLKDPFFGELKAWCKKTGAEIHLGSVPIKDGKKLANATIWVNKKSVKAVYKKIHLFDVDVRGEKRVRESDHFVAGKRPKVVRLSGWQIGLSICYDVRFSNLFLEYAKKEVALILVPSAFLVATGKAHWHTLLKARAIECQAYVVAAAQGGVHRSRRVARRTYGHSLVVGPWGQVLLDGKKTQTYVTELKPDILAQVREQIPMRNHRI